MNYTIHFYTLYLEQLIEVWQSEFGQPLPYMSQNHHMVSWNFLENEHLREETWAWLVHLEAAGFARHLKRKDIDLNAEQERRDREALGDLYDQAF